ncbi:MAG: hypothetical protein KJZ78_05145, partial [Bryobacteraceae bacterium]|nr:hypothetical protein [Bryobacteraceae bacterium]
MRWGITQFVLGTDRKMMGDSEPCDRTDVVVDSYPAPDAIRLELERILRSEYFINAERLSRFLRFIVEQTLAGRAADLKGSILAIEVFDRQTTFDSRFDSIVRVEAQRLRKKLEQFYKAEGVQSPVRIELLKGSYIPIFHGINSPERQAQADPAPTPAPPPQKRTTYSRSRLA